MFFVFLLAGCAGKTTPSISPEKQVLIPSPPPDREFPVAIRLASHQVSTPAGPIAPEAVHGVWLRDEGNVRTWLRLESPRIHLAWIDKDKGIGVIQDGEFTLTRDGSLFGVLTTAENIKETKMAEALYRGEESQLAHNFLVNPPKKVQHLQLFFLNPQRVGEELVLEGDKVLQGRYRKTAETRPTFARPVPPLGKWECEIWESKVRTTLHLSDKIELEMLDQITGRRLRLAGEYSVTAGNLLYGLFTGLDQSEALRRAESVTDRKTSQAIPPQIFCFRYAVADANRLQIRDIISACLDEKARDFLQRDYHRVQDDKQKPEKMQRRGSRR